MAIRATSTFTVTSSDEAVYDESGDGPKLTRATVKKSFQGDIVGESTAEILASKADDGSAGYVAQERVRGRIGERSGAFVIQHGAVVGEPGGPRTFGFIVPGSGSGDLCGLHGEVDLRHEEITLDYVIEEALSPEASAILQRLQVR